MSLTATFEHGAKAFRRPAARGARMMHDPAPFGADRHPVEATFTAAWAEGPGPDHMESSSDTVDPLSYDVAPTSEMAVESPSAQAGDDEDGMILELVKDHSEDHWAWAPEADVTLDDEDTNDLLT